MKTIEDFRTKAKRFMDAETMAAEYLAAYFDNQTICYPISPFKMLKDEGVHFLIQNYSKLEGVYIPASDEKDVAVVGINANRAITRQRFTAAHELCHHFRDADKQVACPIGTNNEIESFAEAFAAAVLMPLQELKYKIAEYKDDTGNVSFDGVLEIADYFGVSFEACLSRIAYKFHAIEGDIRWEELKMRKRKYKPDKKREKRGMTYANLYADLIDNYEDGLRFVPNDFAKNIFVNTYIYNDSRMEGLDVTLQQASEIVTDLRMNTQNSDYCDEVHEPYMSIAGHYLMYRHIFELPVKDKISIYDMLSLNKNLFAYYPHPEFGGNPRQNNVLVIGAKFETVDYHDIFGELEELDLEIKNFFSNKRRFCFSEYIKHVARIHHRLTVIHPFPEGNGRTTRAFMNVQLVRAGISPLYIKVGEKKKYIKALEIADTRKDYEPLYEIIFKVILRCSAELSSNYI